VNVHLYCNVDSAGRIIESISGERVIPEKQYEYFFFLVNTNSETVTNNIPNYRVVNRELTLI